MSFSLIPLKLFMKRFWQSVRETQCLSKAHLSLPSQTFYKRAERTRGSTVRSQKGSLRDLHIILLCSFIRSKTLGLKLKTLSVFWVCNCDDSDGYKFFLWWAPGIFCDLTCWTDPSVLYEIQLQTVLCPFNFQASLLRTGIQSFIFNN